MILNIVNWFKLVFSSGKKNLWPDWDCTKEVSHGVVHVNRTADRKLMPVKPLVDNTLVDMPFDCVSDGKQWVVSSNDAEIYGILGFRSFFLFIGVTIFGLIIAYWQPGIRLLSYGLILLFAGYLIAMCRVRRHRQSWVVFDRETGNVCFWHKNRRNSLTVPFEDVECYRTWLTFISNSRGGGTERYYVYFIAFRPRSRLPFRKQRVWVSSLGFRENSYEEVCFVWGLVTRFMKEVDLLPSVPNLNYISQYCESNSLSLKDIVTECGYDLINSEVTDAILQKAELYWETKQEELTKTKIEFVSDPMAASEKFIACYESICFTYRSAARKYIIEAINCFEGIYDEPPKITSNTSLEAVVNTERKRSQRNALDILNGYFFSPYSYGRVNHVNPCGFSEPLVVGVNYGLYLNISSSKPSELRNIIDNIDNYFGMERLYVNSRKGISTENALPIPRGGKNRGPLKAFLRINALISFLLSMGLAMVGSVIIPGGVGLLSLFLAGFLLIFLVFNYLCWFGIFRRPFGVLFRDKNATVKLLGLKPLIRDKNRTLSCYLPSISKKKGVSGRLLYGLCLIDRDAHEKSIWSPYIFFGANLKGVYGSKEDAYKLWEFLQQFSDPTKPLPDVPELEPYRRHSAITSAWDRFLNRPPRLFERMSDEKFQQYKERLAQYERLYNWNLTREENIKLGWQPPPQAWWTLL